MRFGGPWLGLVLVAGVLTARDAGAVGTRTFELDSIEELSGGDLAGVSVGSDGVVRAGWTVGNVPLPEDAGTTVTCAAELPDGSVLVGTGPASGGKVVRVVNDRATVFADTKESAVVAIAVDKTGAAYAATTGNKIYRITQGRADVFATLPDVESVFAIAFDPSGAGVYAATGPEGRVLRVDAKGAVSTYFKTDSPFVVSLAVAADGVVYAGTSGKGVLYRITAPGRATVLYDFHAEEVHAVAIGPRRSVWAIVNETSGGAPAEPAEAATPRRNPGGRTQPGPSPAPRGKPGKGTLWRFDADGHPERLMHHDESHYTSLALDARGAPYVGTGADGRVYTVDEAHVVSLLADTDERQIGAIGVGRTRFAVGSDPAVFHRVLSVGGPDAVWTSKPLDAGLRARFGHAGWLGTGLLEVSTRTGDTQTPDATWSPWSTPIANGDATSSPAGRFVQLRARLRDAAATISDVTLAFVTENLRAIVTEVSARPKGGTPRDSKEGIVQSGSDPPKHDNVMHVAWKVDNPDSDELRYRVQFRREGDQRWVDATRPDDVLTKAELDWDTAALQEGRYRLRVEATDEVSNPPGSVTRHTLESGPVLVDNTPPVVRTLTVQARRLRAEVVDGLGPIARVEVAVDGRPEWHPIAPVDGIYDTALEAVDLDLTPLLPPGPGAHLVALRAYDAAGNFVVRETESP
jgi:sugar lactone lactonase YvrE